VAGAELQNQTNRPAFFCLVLPQAPFPPVGTCLVRLFRRLRTVLHGIFEFVAQIGLERPIYQIANASQIFST